MSIRITQVTGIDPQKKQIETQMGQVWYDYLVIATGATTNYFGMEGVTKYGIPMKSVSEAVYLRNSVITSYSIHYTKLYEVSRYAFLLKCRCTGYLSHIDWRCISINHNLKCNIAHLIDVDCNRQNSRLQFVCNTCTRGKV